MSIRLLRRPEVEKLTGLSRSSIYALMDRGAASGSVPWRGMQPRWSAGWPPVLKPIRVTYTPRSGNGDAVHVADR